MSAKSTRRIRIIVLIGLAFLFLSAVFPLRRFAGNRISEANRYTPGRAFIYSDGVVRNKAIEVDLSRVLLEWMMILSLTAGASLCLSLQDKADGEEVTATDTDTPRGSS